MLRNERPAAVAAWETALVAPLLWARGLRDFGDGFAAVLLPAFLLAMGLSPWQVGVLSSVSLFCSSLLTLTLGMLSARLEHRRLLLAAACLMAVTGIMFSLAETFAFLLLFAFTGTINSNSGSVSVFVPMSMRFCRIRSRQNGARPYLPATVLSVPLPER